ncbi:MAG: hypothetical protein J4G14_09010 [Dehalococcoidia bacterium]|nr:hypothetical protein [Dehalococcoidia bacterium]
MPVDITIEDVPEDIRDELEARAGRRGQSLEDYIRCELKRIASIQNDELSGHSTEEWVKRVRRRVEESGIHVPASAILEARDADRR